MNRLTPLTGKKVLLFVPNFFNYSTLIYNKIKELGAEAYLYDERSITSAIDRALLKFCPDLFNGKTKKYYRSIVEEHRGERFDYVLIVKCDMPNEKVLKNLRSAFPSAKFCLYLWDSIRNENHILDKVKYFDYASSFDRTDCELHSEFSFRPLFFADDFCCENREDNKYIYDISFVGTIHSDRYRIIKAVRDQCEEIGLSYYGFHYLQSKFMYNYFKLTDKSFKHTNKSYFDFEKKSSAEIADIIDKSLSVLDIQHPRQTGLTMRTIEMIGMEKKLITTNQSVKEYDFYDENNILIIDRSEPVIKKEFFETPYHSIPENIYNKYTLENWIYDVLSIGSAS